MSHPLDFIEGSEKYSSSYVKCFHGVYLATSCSICQSQSWGKSKAVSKAKIQKLEKQLPQIQEESITEELIPERGDTPDDPRELGEEIEATDVEVETYSEAERTEATL